MIQEISVLKNAGKSFPNSVWCMSKCQAKAGYATIVIKFSFLQYPLKSWSSKDLRSLHDHDPAPQALKQLFPLSRLTLLPPPLHHLYCLHSWRSCLCWVHREGWRGGCANPPLLAVPVLELTTEPDHKAWGWQIAYSSCSSQSWSQSPC